jgi:hypothetical protein
MWRNVEGSDRPQMTIWCMHIAWFITKATNTHTICNNYCFSTATLVAGTLLSVPLYVHCLSCSFSLRETLLIYDVWLGSVVANTHSTTRVDHPDGCIFSFKLLLVDLRRLEWAMCRLEHRMLGYVVRGFAYLHVSERQHVATIFF